MALSFEDVRDSTLKCQMLKIIGVCTADIFFPPFGKGIDIWHVIFIWHVILHYFALYRRARCVCP
jgi:hypothetical protein